MLAKILHAIPAWWGFTTTDVNLGCIKSHWYHVVFIRTCNVFIVFMFVIIIVLHTLSISTDCVYVCYV